MTFSLLKLKIQRMKLDFQLWIASKIYKTACKYEWFYKAYGWYFKRFRFNESYEYGAMKIVLLCDEYNEKKMASIFNWQVKMLIPENLHNQIQYLKCKSGGFMKDTIGWIYSPKVTLWPKITT